MNLEIDGFFGEIASLRMDLSDYEKWCKNYESFRYKYPQWKMKNGKGINLYDMEDNHLANTIRLVEKKDPENTWLKVLKQEETYRKLKKEIFELKLSLERMEEISDKVF